MTLSRVTYFIWNYVYDFMELFFQSFEVSLEGFRALRLWLFEIFQALRSALKSLRL